jgi:hypothetical protein
MMRGVVFLFLLVSEIAFAANWDESLVQDGIVYFRYYGEERFDRFDLQTETFLESIPSSNGRPLAFEVTESEIFYSVSKEMYAMGLNGENPTFILRDPGWIRTIARVDDFLVVCSKGRSGDREIHFVTYDLIRRRIIDRASHPYRDFSYYGSFVSELSRKIFTFDRDSGYFLRSIQFDSDGFFHEGFQSGIPRFDSTRSLHFSPDGQVAFGGNGSAYDLITLGRIGNLGGTISDLEFVDNHPVVFRTQDEKFIRYNDEHIAKTHFEPVFIPHTFHVKDEFIYSFFPMTDDSIGLERIELNEFEQIFDPKPITVPDVFSYASDFSEMDENGIIFLPDLRQNMIHRFNVFTGVFGNSIPLAFPPRELVLFNYERALFVMHDQYLFTVVDLDAPGLSRNISVYNRFNMPKPIAIKNQLLWGTRNIYTMNTLGMISHYHSRLDSSVSNPIWDTTSQDLFFNYDGIKRTSMNDDGLVNLDFESVSTHEGDLEAVSPDGRLLLLLDGQFGGKVLKVNTGSKRATLTQRIDRGLWVNDTLFIQPYDGTTRESTLTTLDSDSYEETATFVSPTNYRRLFARDDVLVAVGSQNNSVGTTTPGVTTIHLYDEDLVEQPFLVNTQICETFEPTLRQFDNFESAFERYSIRTADLEGLPMHASLALIEEVACHYGRRKPLLSDLAEVVFHSNVDAFTMESAEDGLSFYRHFIPTAMMIGSSAQLVIRNALAEYDIVLNEEYQVLTDGGGAFVRTANEVFSGLGDLDEDGFTNAEEWLEVMAAGGTLEDFVRQAAPRTDGGSGNRKRCLIATIAHGTPLADELDSIRVWRDGYLMNNPAGALIASTYYRLSPTSVKWVGENTGVWNDWAKILRIVKLDLALGSVLLSVLAMHLFRKRKKTR